MSSRLARALVLVVVVAVVAGACGGDVRSHRTAGAPSSVVESRRATTTTTLPAYASLVAQAIVPSLPIFDDPDAPTPARVLDNPWAIGPASSDAKVPQVFLVEAQRADGWVRILLPVRPNGSTGWVRGTDVSITEVSFRVRVEVGARRVTVFDEGKPIYEGPVAVGAPATPTPTGRYYIRVLIKARDPNTVYGPYAYGLSSHSNALTTFAGGDAEIGLHGNDDASALGRDVTHGCVRMDNGEITELAGLLPLGTPVDIVA